MYAERNNPPPKPGPGYAAGTPYDSPGTVFTVRRMPLTNGDESVRETVREMRKLVIEGGRDGRIAHVAARFQAQNKGGSGKDFVRRLGGCLRNSFRYVADPPELESIWSPRIHCARYCLFGKTWGDCDDATVWSLAVARACGIPCRIVTIANGKKGLRYNHVFGECLAEGEWIMVDLTAPLTPHLRRATWPV